MSPTSCTGCGGSAAITAPIRCSSVASATIANPRELAERLTGLPFAVVDEDGAPRGTKHFFFWNPPRLGPAGMERRSANSEAREILVRLVRDGYQAIVFVKTRP